MSQPANTVLRSAGEGAALPNPPVSSPVPLQASLQEAFSLLEKSWLPWEITIKAERAIRQTEAVMRFDLAPDYEPREPAAAQEASSDEY